MSKKIGNQVDTYHINIGVGDCSVVLDVDPVKKIINNCVLIDGGYGTYKKQFGPWQAIKDFMTVTLPGKLKNLYYTNITADQLKFTSIVISHWDGDHYGGVLDLIYHDLNEQRINSGNPDAYENLKCTWMKYKKDDQGKLVPQTTLYIPYLVKDPFENKQGARRDSVTSNSLDSNLMDFNIGDVDPNNRKWVTAICKFKYNTEDLLGINLFAGTRPANYALDAYASPGPLATASQSDSNVCMGGLYIIAANETCLEKPGSHGRVEIVNRRITTGESDETNGPSIVCIVAWPTGMLGASDTGLVSYYLAGDALWDFETTVAAWIGTNVKAMKLSHHGAAYSSPSIIFDTFQPAKVVVSAWNSHLHPAWQTLMWLYYFYCTDEDNEVDMEHLFLTNYPYWLAIKENGDPVEKVNERDMIPNADPTSLPGMFQAECKKTGGKVWDAHILEFEKKTTPEAQQKWIVDWVRDRLWMISDDLPFTIMARGATSGASASAVVTPDNDIDYIVVFNDPINNKTECSYGYRMDPGISKNKPTYKSSRRRSGTTYEDPTKEYSLRMTPARQQRPVKAVIINSSSSSGKAEDQIDTAETDADTGQQSESTNKKTVLPKVSAPQRLDIVRAATPSPYHYVCADGVVPPPDGTSTSLSQTDPLNDLLLLLNTRVAVLETEMSGTINLSASVDEMGKWFIAALLADSVSVTTSDSEAITSFTIKMTNPANLTFSTNSIPKPIKDNMISTTSFGFSEDCQMLILGLEITSNTKTSWTLTDILQYFGQDDGTYLNGLMGDLTSTISLNLQLDPNTSKNAIWFYPFNSNLLTQRLEFTFTADFVTKVQEWVNIIFGNTIQIGGGSIIGKLSVLKRELVNKPTPASSSNNPPPVAGGLTALDAAPSVNDPPTPQLNYMIQNYSQMTLSVSIKSSTSLSTGITGYMVFDPDSGKTTFILEPNPGTTFEDLLNWMVEVLAGIFHATDVQDILSWLPQDSSTNKPTHEALPKRLTIQSDGTGIILFGVDVELEVEFGKQDGVDKNICFFLSYTWRKYGPTHTFRGSLWCPPDLTGDAAIPSAILPWYEDYQNLAPATPDLVATLHLSNIVPDQFKISSWPKELDPKISKATITLSSDGIMFEGELVGTTDPNVSQVGFQLGTVQLNASSLKSTGTNIYFSADIIIVGQQEDNPTNLVASLEYDRTDPKNSTWVLEGIISDCILSHLFYFFPAADGGTVMTIMDHIIIQLFGLSYTYSSTGVGNSFTASARIMLDVVELELSFVQPLSGEWTFFAELTTAPDTDTSFLTILKSFVKDSTILDDVPSFLDIPIQHNDTPGATGGIALELWVSKTTEKNKEEQDVKYLNVILMLTLGSLQISFIQQKENVTGSTSSLVKRVIHVSITNLPFDKIPSIPVVGSLKQPFDEIDYVWVHDDSGSTTPGLTRLEISALNAITNFPGLKYKDDVKTPTDNDVLLAAGSHFIIMDTGNVKLDYVFGKPSPPPTPHPTSNSAGTHEGVVSKDTQPDDDDAQNETSMGQLEKSQGPLTISNVGLKYSNNTVQFFFDAAVKLGPIEFSLMGFGFGIKFDDGVSLRGLDNITPTTPTLSGLACAFSEPPMDIAGIFLNESGPGVTKYAGGITVTIPPWAFIAVGSYAEYTGPPPFKSIFMFMELQGPLIEFEVVEVSGITAGFGFNSYLRMPDLPSLLDFPLISNSFDPPGPDPVALLEKFTGTSPPEPYQGWISDMDGPMWFCAGLTCKAVQMLNVNAVVTLAFDPGLKIGIFAHAVGMMPGGPDANKDDSFLYIELAMDVIIDIAGGAFICEANLSPNSFVLDPMCHLSGGFAFCYWYTGSGHEGDFVFSVGGYHSAYQPPDWYPRPDRLQIQWDLGCLTITGQAYFAITPKCCMGGGFLQAVLSAGPLGAYFNAYADFLINYNPFHFLGDVGVDVGVSFTLDLWICTIYISVTISAEVTLHGPPFGGEAYVDFWVFGFTVSFGDQGGTPAPLNLEQFYQLLLQQPGASPTPTSNGDHVLGIVSGMYSPGAKDMKVPPGSPWLVRRSGFQFSVRSRFAISAASVNGGNAKTTPTSIYSKPMHLHAPLPEDETDQYIDAPLTVTIARVDAAKLGTFTYTSILNSMPKALWGSYDPSLDPSSGSDSSRALLSNGDLTESLLMGLTIVAPKPFLANDPILPFDALAAMSEEIFTDQDWPDGKTHTEAWRPPLASTPYPPATPRKWDPIAPATAADTDPAKQWEAVSGAWRSPGFGKDNVYKGMQIWKQAFGWGVTTTVAPVVSSSLKEMELDYLAAPLLAAA